MSEAMKMTSIIHSLHYRLKIGTMIIIVIDYLS